MIKVIVAEDQPLILRNIKHQIEAFGNGIKIVGEAADGQIALSLVKELKPDIVFTDIRMPVMDGLQLISEARNFCPNTQFVIISGFDEFEYARQAMKLNVTEYLLKPVSEKDIHDTLESLVKIVNIQNEDNELQLLSDILYSKTIHPVVHDTLGCSAFSIFLLCAGSYSNFIIDYGNSLNNFWSNIDLYKILSAHLPQSIKFWCFDGKNFNEKVLILGLTENAPETLDNFADNLIQDLSRYNAPINIVVNQTIKDINSLGIEHQLMRAVLRKNLVFGKSNVFVKNDFIITSAQKDWILDSSFDKKLLNFIQNNQKNLFYKEIFELLKYWEKNSFTQASIEKLLKQLAKLFRKHIISHTGLIFDLEMEIDELLSISKDYNSLSQGITYLFDQFFNLKNENIQSYDSSNEIGEKSCKLPQFKFHRANNNT